MSMVLIFVGLIGIITCVILIILFNVKKEPIKTSLIILGVSIALLFIGLAMTLFASTAEVLKQPTINTATLPSTTTRATLQASAYDTTQPVAMTVMMQQEAAYEND